MEHPNDGEADGWTHCATVSRPVYDAAWCGCVFSTAVCFLTTLLGKLPRQASELRLRLRLRLTEPAALIYGTKGCFFCFFFSFASHVFS